MRKTIILVSAVVVLVFVVVANIFISKNNISKYQLCNSLNNGDYTATQECFNDE